jgi:hypothetical protein
MVLTAWDAAGRLKIVMQKIESTPGMGANQSCTALEVFKTKALPAMRALIDITGDEDIGPGYDGGKYDGSVIGQSSCVGCHSATGPSNEGPPTSTQAFDLRTVDSDVAVACSFARIHINFQNKAQSLILQTPIGNANPNHSTKPLADNDPVIEGIREWVNAEQP